MKNHKPLAPGDVIQDNDPRTVVAGWVRTLVVDSVTDDYVFAHRKSEPAARVRLSLKRVHLDGKPRRSGFTRISTAETTP